MSTPRPLVVAYFKDTLYTMYSIMAEKQSTHQLLRERRPDYGAIPFDPWTAFEVTGEDGKAEPYVNTSLNRIRKGVDVAVDEAVLEHDWTESPELAERLHAMIELSLYDSLCYRIQLNPGAQIHEKVDSSDPRFEEALDGTASPLSLLSLLIDYPELGSLEIAKLFHPLDSTATTQMDIDVLRALTEAGFSPSFEEARYKTKSYQPDIPAMTTLRKRTVAELRTPDGMFQIVQRKAFLVRGDEEAAAENDPYLGRKVRNSERHGEIYDKVEGLVSLPYDTPAEDAARKWLQPLATSYYVKFVELPTPGSGEQVSVGE